MLAGEAVVAIWNGITAEGRDEFYAWHIHEHMPERVGIPGFRRGRRYIAVDGATHPEFFTLYETDTMQVLQGQDYNNRLNAPTPWTRSATAGFRDTSRSLARVVSSLGPGMGGAILTVRFVLDDIAALIPRVREIADRPRICGAHLCVDDDAASSVVTEEKRGRADIQAPPSSFAMIEATGADALADIMRDGELASLGASGILRGIYALEYTRTKTAWA